MEAQEIASFSGESASLSSGYMGRHRSLGTGNPGEQSRPGRGLSPLTWTVCLRHRRAPGVWLKPLPHLENSRALRE